MIANGPTHHQSRKQTMWYIKIHFNESLCFEIAFVPCASNSSDWYMLCLVNFIFKWKYFDVKMGNFSFEHEILASLVYSYIFMWYMNRNNMLFLKRKSLYKSSLNLACLWSRVRITINKKQKYFLLPDK